MLYLSGGGDEAASAPLDRQFARAVAGRRLLYLPVAMDGASPTHAECHAWLRGVFGPLGIDDIVMWQALSPRLVPQMRAFDGVCIGGGNTYRLMAALRASGFDRALATYRGHIYGGSAGAIVLGRDIATCLDANELGVADTRGLGLLGGYAVWCHYAETHAGAVEVLGMPTIAIPEQSGVLVDGGVMSVAGPVPVTVFHCPGRERLAPHQAMATGG